jgi:hypothetical protein
MNKYEREHIRDIALRNQKISRVIDGAMVDLSKRFQTVKGKRFAGVLKDRFAELQVQISNNGKDGMRNQWTLANKMNNAKIDGYLEGVKVSDALAQSYRAPNLGALNAIIDRTENGMNLSKRVWNMTNGTKIEIESLISQGVLEGKSARVLSKELKDFVKGKPIRYGGKLIKGANLNYQAIRLAATELNLAFRTSDYLQNSRLPFVTGVTIELSAAHLISDVCDELQGHYPKGFNFTGWHSLCYSSDTEVYTNDGWKLFKELSGDEQIISLNPDTKDLEWTPIVKKISYWYNGEMYGFRNSNIDMLVTPDHEMIFVCKEDGKIHKLSAKIFSEIMDNNLYLMTGRERLYYEDNFGIIIKTGYSDYVYDIEVEKNHIIYVRRNGKCVWGSNCICFATWDTLPKEEFAKYIETGNIDQRRFTRAIPQKAQRYIEKNGERLLGYKNPPYWLTGNFNEKLQLVQNELTSAAIQIPPVKNISEQNINKMISSVNFDEGGLGRGWNDYYGCSNNMASDILEGNIVPKALLPKNVNAVPSFVRHHYMTTNGQYRWLQMYEVPKGTVISMGKRKEWLNNLRIRLGIPTKELQLAIEAKQFELTQIERAKNPILSTLNSTDKQLKEIYDEIMSRVKILNYDDWVKTKITSKQEYTKDIYKKYVEKKQYLGGFENYKNTIIQNSKKEAEKLGLKLKKKGNKWEIIE